MLAMNKPALPLFSSLKAFPIAQASLEDSAAWAVITSKTSLPLSSLTCPNT
jgi:hypothetical protein